MAEILTNYDVIDPQYKRLLGTKTGIVNDVYTTLPSREDPESYLSRPQTCGIGYLAGVGEEVDLGIGGKGYTLEGSCMSSIGETVERYCLCFPDEAALERGTYNEMADRGPIVDFEYLNIYDPEIMGDRLSPFDRETEIYWVGGRNLLTGESVYVPAELVWSDMGPLEGITNRFLGTTNGCAAGGSKEMALVESIMELVERDGFMRTWAYQRSPQQIDPSDFPDVVSFRDEKIENDSLRAHIWEYETRLDIPTIGAAIVNETDERPKFIIGGAADLDPTEAMKDAMVETIQGWPYVAEIAIEQGVDDVDPNDPNDNFNTNVLYYSLPEHFDEVNHLVRGERTRFESAHLPDVDDWSYRDRLKYCLDQFDRAGMTPIAFDLTTRDVAEAGFDVTRVYVPELVGLSPPFTLPVEHPAFAGDADELTDKPHPYP